MKDEAIISTSPWQAGLPPQRPTWQRWVRGFLLGTALASGVLFTVAVIQPRGLRLAPVTQDAMGQTIPVGSLAVVVPAAAYQTHDVVAYAPDQEAQTLSTSRVMSRTATGVGPTRYRLQDDDATRLERQAVTAENLVGRVELVVPWIGYLLAAVQTTLGFVGLIILPLMAVILTSFQDARRQWRLALYESTFYPGPSFTARHHHA